MADNTVLDTIAAIATARGQAALGILRISGSDAARILAKVVSKTSAIKNQKKMTFGLARNIETGSVIDEVMCFYSSGPHTSTGEDVAEIHGHGGTLVMQSLLDQALLAGARIALPGEFTSRAFLNNKIDLTQAEAVMALIGARSNRAAKTAIKQLAGSLGNNLGQEYSALTQIAAELEAGLDFPDEYLSEHQTDNLADKLTIIFEKLSKATESFKVGSNLTNGTTVVIAGPSNAGKSSLLNSIVSEERAIVDSQPGTTRDIVQANGEIDGIPILFLDTAGLRRKAERIEKRGIQKSKEAAQTADLLLWVLDGTSSQTDFEEILPGFLNDTETTVIVVLNKNDLNGFKNTVSKSLEKFLSIEISAKNGDGLDELKNLIAVKLSSVEEENEVILTTARQHNAVKLAVNHTKRAIDNLRQSKEPELAATDLRWARESLASLWGKNASEEIIDTIFSTFCLGK